MAVRGRVVSGKDAVKDGMKVTVDWRPTARELGEYADDYYKMFEEAIEHITKQVMDKAASAAPRDTGTLVSTLRDSTLRTGGKVMVGFKKSKAPYAAKVHWGAKSPQDPKDWFLYRVVYPKATKRKSGPVADWIVKELQEFVDKAAKEFNLKGLKEVKL